MDRPGGGVARSTIKKMVKGCNPPAPIQGDVTTTNDGDKSVFVRGLNIHPDANIVFEENVNTGTVLTPGVHEAVASAAEALGSITKAYNIANAQLNDTYSMFAAGPCGTRVFIGTLDIQLV